MKRTQDNFEAFKQHLAQALPHLYDPAYRPPDLLGEVLQCRPDSVQEFIRKGILSLKPDAGVPAAARGRRLYQVLDYRYLQGLTQDEAAFRLGISPRHLRREQQQALESLARRLWARESIPTEKPSNEPAATDSLSWKSQIREDLASLQEHAPGVLADVAAVITGAAPLGQLLANRHQLRLEVRPVSAGLQTAVHPTILRQILLTAVEKLVQHTLPGGQIGLDAGVEAGQIVLRISGQPAQGNEPLTSEFIEETLLTQQGEFAVIAEDNRLTFRLMLPPAQPVRVLVVDDNADLVHFYKRYTARTRYEIFHLSEGARLFDTVAKVEPDIIVLDVMLPDVDGWELLPQLHEHPETRVIPVIVCSVVRREELALALGAKAYLAKPVRRQAFIQALDRVQSQASAASPIPPAPPAAI